MGIGQAWSSGLSRGKRTFASSQLASRSMGGEISSNPKNRARWNARIAYLERTQQTLVNTHHCTSIVELSTVVWRREQRNQLSFGEELVSVLDNLVSAAYQVHVVLLKESGDDIWTKSEGDTTVVLGPSGNVLVWVGPEQVAKETAVWDLMWRSVLCLAGSP